MDLRFEGKTALVTGATRGIGLAIARRLLESGARGVAITGRKQERLDTASAELAAGDRVLALEGSSDDELHANYACAKTVESFGSLDILVNNAGTNPAYGNLTDVDLSAVDKVWSVNLRGPLLFVRAAWHTWMREHGGAIVNIASIGGYLPERKLGAYNISKAGLIMMTQQLANETGPNVRVNAVAPGVVKTRLSRALYEENEAGLAGALPLERLGVPEDIAALVAFLAHPASSWMTGETVTTDGGAMLRGSMA